MDYQKLKQIVLEMPLGTRKEVYSINENVVIFVNKPLKVPTKLKNSKRYDPKLNFQVGISKKGYREFLPNHLRVMIDLELKKKENKENTEKLFDIIEKIYDGEDPITFEAAVENLKLSAGFETSFTLLCLAQLFFLEQDINYHFGKVQPPRAYLMGYIRMIRLEIEEIDKLLWNSIRHPPRIKFQSKECLAQSSL